MTFKQLWTLLRNKPTLFIFAGMSMANKQNELRPPRSQNILRAEHNEEQARNLIREATYLRDLEKRLNELKVKQ